MNYARAISIVEVVVCRKLSLLVGSFFGRGALRDQPALVGGSKGFRFLFDGIRADRNSIASMINPHRTIMAPASPANRETSDITAV